MAEQNAINVVPIRRAILSVSNKSGLNAFAQGLVKCGVALYSTGGTRRYLEEAGLAVRDIAEYTGLPEMMDGRVKTLHPKIFGGILARPDHPDDLQSMREHGILGFELVVVNLYPFADTVNRAGATEGEIVEQIDIGGPSLVRAAAKNFRWTAIATSDLQYAKILEQVQQLGGTDESMRRYLMLSAFQHTAQYDRTIADHFGRQAESSEFPSVLELSLDRECTLRYGENSHQAAALYKDLRSKTASIVRTKLRNGKELSYNNILDLDAALAIVRPFVEPACSVIKHNNPCGAALGSSLSEACRLAFEGDPQSAFGSVVAMNRAIDAASADFLASDEHFIEAIVAPKFDDEAFEILTTRPKWKRNVRLLEIGDLDPEAPSLEIRSITGGALIQQTDRQFDRLDAKQIVTQAALSPELLRELEFGWNIVRHVKSNAITLSKARALCGVGAGQMSRVDSVEIGIRKAGPPRQGKCFGIGRVLSFSGFDWLGGRGGHCCDCATRRFASRCGHHCVLQPTRDSNAVYWPTAFSTLIQPFSISTPILGPTPEFVRWSIDTICAIREPIGTTRVEKTERYLRALAALGQCLLEGNVIDDLCIVHSGTDLTAAKGCFLHEVATFYGGLEFCQAQCTPCRANVPLLRENQVATRESSLAGCFGWLVRDETMIERLDEIVAAHREEFMALHDFRSTNPAWYGLWSADKLEGGRRQAVSDIFARLVARDNVPMDWRRFAEALEVCCTQNWPLSVQFVSAGNVEGNLWTIGPYCPNCRAPMEGNSRSCNSCGRRGQGHPAMHRKILGHRPFVPLESLVGTARAQELVARLAAEKAISNADPQRRETNHP